MRKPLALSASILFSLGLPGLSLAQQAPQGGAPQRSAGAPALDPHGFLDKVGEGDLAEIRLSELATQRASDPEVKKYAQQLFEDHAKANFDLARIASEKQFTMPPEPSAEEQATYQRLSQLSGPDFDREFVKAMVKDHEETVALFQQAASSLSDPALKSFAAATLPALQTHLETARRLQSRLLPK